jgi:RNA polymerase sigma factor (sigma-70 family)
VTIRQLLGFGGRRRLFQCAAREHVPWSPRLTLTAEHLGFDRAFEALFAEHYVPLARTLRRLLGDTGQAEEVAADAFSRLYRKSPTMAAIQNSRAWVYRTGMNLALDALRANARRTRREGTAEPDLRRHDNTTDALNMLLAEEQRQRVRAILATLKSVHAQALLLGSDGFSCREVAGILGVKPDSIYTLVARAKVQFERAYVNAYGGAPQ